MGKSDGRLEKETIGGLGESEEPEESRVIGVAAGRKKTELGGNQRKNSKEEESEGRTERSEKEQVEKEIQG